MTVPADRRSFSHKCYNIIIKVTAYLCVLVLLYQSVVHVYVGLINRINSYTNISQGTASL